MAAPTNVFVLLEHDPAPGSAPTAMSGEVVKPTLTRLHGVFVSAVDVVAAVDRLFATTSTQERIADAQRGELLDLILRNNVTTPIMVRTPIGNILQILSGPFTPGMSARILDGVTYSDIATPTAH